MAKEKFIPTISDDLRKTVQQNPHIEKVHFTLDGHHHINVQEDKNSKKKFTRITPTISTDEKNKGRYISGYNPEHEIVATLTRDEILATPDAPKEKTKKDATPDAPKE